ncbi:ERF family protein [Prescottella equi]|uniref:ERF family protein n=1 Tax=Rhodococcus hoagii TaxID=43767 RepID=UPI001F5BDC8A|nr:ERF family protein [Prescottella equi]UNQ40926.1 ERF family protein [Prescottella equi]
MREDINSLLQKVQQALKAPKGQKNTFGNYSYRSAEDILEAVKPHLTEQELTLTISDTIEMIGDRYYVKAQAVVSKGDAYISTSAYAREADDKKGMDAAQVTGATSSYARKYALNGLFAIDDTKDADTDEHRRETTQTAKAIPVASGSRPASDKQLDLARTLYKKLGFTDMAINGRIATIKTSAEASKAIEEARARLDKKAAES